MLSEAESRALTDRVLAMVKADDAVVTVTSTTHAHLRFAANSIQTSGTRDNMGVSVRVWIARKRGEAFTSDLSEPALRAAVDQARSVAELSPVDVEYLPSLGPQTYKPTGGFSEATATMSLSNRAQQIGDILEASEAAKVISAGFHQVLLSGTARATRNGNFVFNRESLVSLGMTARMPDGSSSGYFLRSHFDVSRLDVMRVASEAIRRARESQGAKTLQAGEYPVILEAQAVADLFDAGFLFDARRSEEGRGPFSAPNGQTRVGEKVFDDRLDVVSDPWNAELPGTQGTFEDIPAQEVTLVRGGVLETLVSRRYWATEKKRQPTPGPVNTILRTTGAPVNVEDMIRGAERALLVGRFWYVRMVDPRTATLTGLTRDGVWYIENGRIQYPVRNFRFNQSIIRMLAPGNVDAIGASERAGSGEAQGEDAMLVPALKLRAFNFTSQSEAV